MTPAVTGPPVLKRYRTLPSRACKTTKSPVSSPVKTRSVDVVVTDASIGRFEWFPRDCARRRIHGGEPTARFPDRIEAERSAHILLPRDVPQLVRLFENTAPIHCGRDKQVHCRTECRRAPFEAAKYTGTGVDAFNCRFRVGVGERRERHLVNRFVTFPVNRAQNPILSSNRHQRPLRTTDYRRVQRVGYGQVPVMLVVGNELPEPL